MRKETQRPSSRCGGKGLAVVVGGVGASFGDGGGIFAEDLDQPIGGSAAEEVFWAICNFSLHLPH